MATQQGIGMHAVQHTKLRKIIVKGVHVAEQRYYNANHRGSFWKCTDFTGLYSPLSSLPSLTSSLPSALPPSLLPSLSLPLSLPLSFPEQT